MARKTGSELVTMTDEQISELPIIIDAGDVADMFGISRVQVYRLANRGVIPGFKVGTQWRFRKAAVLQVMGA